MFVGIMHILFKCLNKIAYIKSEGVCECELVLHSFFFFHSDYYHCFVLFSLFFSLFYFCLVCAVAIMGSQPQMSLALPCSALREGH